MRPVLVSQRIDVIDVYDERRDALDQRWTTLLAKIGLFPVPVPNLIDNAGLTALLNLPALAGIILTGGPSLVAYSGSTPERDAVEAAMIEAAEQHHIALLGVCRGLQVLLDRYRSTLVELEGHLRTRHQLQIIGGGPFARRLRAHTHVNSYHELGAHDAIYPLQVVARARDGSVEAVEHVDRPIRAIMWHPERESTAVEANLGLLDWIFTNADAAID